MGETSEHHHRTKKKKKKVRPRCQTTVPTATTTTTTTTQHFSPLFDLLCTKVEVLSASHRPTFRATTNPRPSHVL